MEEFDEKKLKEMKASMIKIANLEMPHTDHIAEALQTIKKIKGNDPFDMMDLENKEV